MFCKNCGVYNTDDSVFCTKCGANLKEESGNAENVEQQGYTPEPVNIQPPYTPPQGNVNNYQMQPPEEPKKKKGKKKAVKGIIIALVVIIVIGIVALFSWTSIARAAVGNMDFYLWRESKNIVSLLDTGVFDNLSHTQTFDSDTDVKIGYDGDELVSGGAEMSYDKEKHSTAATVNIEYEGEKIPVTINYCDGKISVASKDILGDADIYLDLNDLSTLDPTTQSNANSGAGSTQSYDIDYDKTVLNEEAREKVIAALPEIIKKAEKDTLSKNTKTKIGFVDGKPCTIVTIDATAADWAEFVDALWENCKDDDDLMEVIESTVDAVGIINGYTADDLLDEFDKSIDDMVEYADDDISTTFTVAYSLTGNIVQRTVSVNADDEEEYVATLNSNMSGKNKQLSFELTNDGEVSHELSYDVSTKGNKLNGAIKYSQYSKYYGDNTLDIKLEDVGVEKCNSVYVPVGKLTANDGANFNLNVEADSSKDYSISVKGTADGSDFYGTVDSELSDKADLKDFEEPEKDSESISIFDLMNGNFPGNYYGYDPSYQDSYDYSNYGNYDYSDYGNYDYSDYDYSNYDYGDYSDGYDM